MPNFDGGHYFLSALIPIKSGEFVDHHGAKTSPVHRVREELASLPKAHQSKVTEETEWNSPFARNTQTHFARFVVIDDMIYNGRNPVNALTMVSEGDCAEALQRPESGSLAWITLLRRSIWVRKTFRDDQLQQEFAEQGYVVIPCLDPAGLTRARELFERINPEARKGFQVTIYTHAPATRLDISNEMRSFIEPAISRFFDNHRFAGGNFVVKWPGIDSEVGAHQDWAFVDESQYCSINIWCPLCDTDDRNGTLGVVPGSHNVIPKWSRGSPPLAAEQQPCRGLERVVAERYGKKIPVRAGDAIAYNHALLHFSPPNRSTEPRIAAAMTVVPKDATLVHFFWHNSGRVEAFEVDESFLSTFEVGTLPEGVKSLGEGPSEIPIVNPQAFGAPAGSSR